MPYYRITIWLKENQLNQGIRYYENSNIDAVTNIARVKAKQHYGENNVTDVEAAMLSNHCTAVKKYQVKQEKRKENKKFNEGIESTLGITKSRKSNYKKPTSMLGNRDQIKDL